MMKRIALCIFALLLVMTPLITASADVIPDERLMPRVYDEGDLLTSDEEAMLLSKLDGISENLQCDVAVATVNTLGGKTSTEYADDYYDYNGFGFGENRDGILLLVCLEERDWATSTCGKATHIFTDSDLYDMEEYFIPYLSAGDYYTAFDTFADLCEEEISSYGKFQFSFFYIVLAVIIGAVIAFIVVLVMKSQLKSVRFQPEAQNYIRKNSLKLTEQKDFFLYSHVARKAKPKENSGSSTHVSSSGTFHGGSSGKF